MSSSTPIPCLDIEGAIETLRPRYEAEGYTFTVAPDPSLLPNSGGSYAPAAVARKPGHNIAIEVKASPANASQPSLQEIRRLLEGHMDWDLSVVSFPTKPEPIRIPSASPAAIRSRLDEARALGAAKQNRAALVMLWSLLEGIVQTVDGNETGPLMSGTVVQSLVMNGLLDPDIEPRLRGLIPMRNRIVHGDVGAEPAATDIEFLLSVAAEALSNEAA